MILWYGRNKKNYFVLSYNKFPGKCWYGGHPWIRLAMESESMVEKGINFIFCLGTAYDISSMESVGNSKSFSLVGKVCLSKCFYLSIFALSSGTSTNPYFPLRRAFLILYAIFILASSLTKAPTKRQYDHTWVLGVANMWVSFMNGSMIEHNGLGITYFSVDILKDLVSCWYAWVFKLSGQN